MKYKLTETNKHFVVEIENYKFVIDSGVNISLTCNNNLKNININNKTYNLMKYSFGPIEQLYKLVGMEVDGLLGLDVINNGLTLNRIDKTVTFGIDDFEIKDAKVINYKNSYGYRVDIKFLGKEYKNLFLDTGAFISYLKTNFDNLNSIGESRDFSPLIQEEIISKKYDLNVRIKDNDFPLTVAKPSPGLNNVLDSYHADGIISIYDLFNYYARFYNNKLYLK